MYDILIVEDNKDNMAVMEAFLEDDFNLLCATDGYEGLKMAKEHKPDVILMDISLPGMDGVEALNKIRTAEGLENTVVVALTAHAMVGDKENYLAKGFDAYMSKPVVDDEALIDMINELLEE